MVYNMSLYYRLRRRLGYDTTTTIVHEQPRYEYTVTHLNGVQEVEREQIGTDRWIFTVDKADNSLLDTETEYEPL